MAEVFTGKRKNGTTNKRRLSDRNIDIKKGFDDNYDLIVFSHLRWQFVYQRPQHIISRFAKNRKVLFIEDPVHYHDEVKVSTRVIAVSENITVIQPIINHADYEQELPGIIQQLVKTYVIQNPVLWFYSPIWENITSYISHKLIVYDCMDELSGFKFAPPSLIEKEKNLLSKADIVFTGGKSLFEAKKVYNKNCYCFPSSVDTDHFRNATSASLEIPEDIKNIPGKKVAYYGVIDERIDLGLLSETADALPEIAFIMIGPLAKIAESDLPRNKNIYYLGMKSYNMLPAYLKGFDIAMMPFAMNDATRFISPTKTLEYMAAEKPVISTPVYDVVRDYKDVVSIAHTSAEFVAAIKYYLNEPANAFRKRIKAQREILKTTSWDHTAARMNQILSDKIINKTSQKSFLEI